MSLKEHLEEQKVFVAEQLKFCNNVSTTIALYKKNIAEGGLYDPWYPTEQRKKLSAHEQIAKVLFAAAEGVAAECNLQPLRARNLLKQLVEQYSCLQSTYSSLHAPIERMLFAESEAREAYDNDTVEKCKSNFAVQADLAAPALKKVLGALQTMQRVLDDILGSDEPQ